MMNSKGGIISRYEKVRRTEPCMEPTYFVAIDYNGMVTPCCHIRSDEPSHQGFILGDLHNHTLKEIYESRTANMFRKHTAMGTFEFYDPCRYCNKTPGRYIRDDAPGIKWEDE